MKSSDNKLIASAWLCRMKTAYVDCTVDIQRGFVPSQQFVRTIVDLVAQARIESMPHSGNKLVMLIFWGVAAAF